MILLQIYNPILQLAFTAVKMLYKIPAHIFLHTAVHQGCLYYRLPGAAKRISYRQLKNGLLKQTIQLPLISPHHLRVPF